MRRARLAAAALLLALSGCSGEDGRADARGTPGVTAAPCPDATNPDNGCIYLGTLTDLTGPFSAISSPATRAQEAFWKRVNQQGGIGGHDIDVTRYLRDTGYDEAAHERLYAETKDHVLAYAQMIGSPHTNRVLHAMLAEKVITTPLSWTSQWNFVPNVLEAGGSYCVEAMNAVDYAADTFAREKKPYKVESVMSIGYPGEFGADSAGGARIAAQRRGLDYHPVLMDQGTGAKPVAQILKRRPDLVVIAAAPGDTTAIVKAAVQQGYKGRFIGNNPSWIQSMAGMQGFRGRFWLAGPWRPYATDSPGHAAMRAALGDVAESDAYVSGWTYSYGLKAALENTVKTGRLTRAGLLKAAGELTQVDYEGILPEEAGNMSHPFRQTVFSVPDKRQYTGIRVVEDFYEGPTARTHELTEPCAEA
ncbi:ABC transporter substrate-binding protein [Actinocorallia populi]|uniref:ABC transporter substrate-binding protein n=1 Tax=Actinocorallia populi TaxID=2079200 RepID=UPI000D095815|nr:ABC transporter substrate-binding protein [Actinocorallia populi]